MQSESQDQELDTEQKVKQAYEHFQVQGLTYFGGGFINSGYWKDIPIDLQNDTISEDQRVLASQNLYHLVFQHLKILHQDKVLEVGSGLGKGCHLLKQCSDPEVVAGIDISADHVKYAQETYANEGLEFKEGSAEKIPFPDQYFSKILSVSSAHHFPSILNFGKECNRVLIDGGFLGISCLFSTSEEGYQKLGEYDPWVTEGLDLFIPINSVRTQIIQAGFEELKFFSYGQYSFPYDNKYKMQTLGKNPWNLNEAFQNKYIDAYVMIFKKK